MQDFFDSPRDYLIRTDRLAARMGLNVEDLAGIMGIGRASLFSYRTGKRSITRRAWMKLEEAERQAGIPPDGSSDKPAFPKYELRAPAEPSIRQQIMEMNRKLDALLDLFQGRSS